MPFWRSPRSTVHARESNCSTSTNNSSSNKIYDRTNARTKRKEEKINQIQWNILFNSQAVLIQLNALCFRVPCAVLRLHYFISIIKCNKLNTNRQTEIRGKKTQNKNAEKATKRESDIRHNVYTMFFCNLFIFHFAVCCCCYCRCLLPFN